MKIRNPVLYGLFFIFFIVNILDLYTSRTILVAETNPIYLLFGNFWSLILLKCVFLIPAGIIIFKNNYPGHITNYIMISYFIFGTLLTLLAVISNSNANTYYNNLDNEQKIEFKKQIEEIPKVEKISMYGKFVGAIYLAPLVLSLVTFILYRWNLRYCNIDKKYNKIKYWWKE